MDWLARLPVFPLLPALFILLGIGLAGFLYWRFRVLPRLLERLTQLELEAVAQAGSAIVAATLNVEDLCELIYQEANKLIETQTFQVGLFEENRYRIQVWVIDGERQPPASFDLTGNSGLVGWTRDNKTPLLVHDFEAEMETLPARPRYISHNPPRSAIFVPFISGDEVLGILAAQSNIPNYFNANQLRLLNIIANQAGSAIANAHLYEEVVEREKLAQELRVAHQIQASLIPAGNPTIPKLQVASVWTSARQVSGDFYDFFRLRDGNWGIVVADVADKGMPAAIFMAVSRTILRSVAFNRSSPAHILERANDILFNDTQTDLFVTTFYVVWNPETSTIQYACGGHNPALYLPKVGRSCQLTTDGIALGVLEEVSIEEKKIHLHAGDTLLIYTDGVTEAFNEGYEEFGLARLQTVAETHRDEPAEQIVQAVLSAVHEHTGEMAQSDDLTLVVIKYL